MATRTKALRTVFAIAAAAAILALTPPPASAAGTTITLEDLPAYATTYMTSTIVGSVSPADATPKVYLQWKTGGVWRDIDSAAVRANSYFELHIYPHHRGTYVLRVRSQHGSVVSAPTELVVAPAPTRVEADTTSAGPFVVGDRVAVTGRVIEPTATGRVVVQRNVDGRWSDRQAGSVDQTTGRFRVAITPSQVGWYGLRVRTDGGSRWSETFFFYVGPKPVP